MPAFFRPQTACYGQGIVAGNECVQIGPYNINGNVVYSSLGHWVIDDNPTFPGGTQTNNCTGSNCPTAPTPAPFPVTGTITATPVPTLDPMWV